MQGDKDVIEFLNEHLTRELTLINQYFLNHKMLDNWGLPGLGSLFRSRSMEEMEDTEELIERILFLEGHPNVQRYGTVEVGEDPVEMIELGAEAELDAVEALRRGIKLAFDKEDFGSSEMLERMLEEEEEHLDYFEGQMDALEAIGVENYLARYSMPEST